MTENLPQQSDGLAVQEAKPKLKKPQLYKVILLNDDFTPMEFVVRVLERFFHKNREEATRIMLQTMPGGSSRSNRERWMRSALRARTTATTPPTWPAHSTSTNSSSSTSCARSPSTTAAPSSAGGTNSCRPRSHRSCCRRRVSWSSTTGRAATPCSSSPPPTASSPRLPIAEQFGIPHLIATEPEERDGQFTGRVTGEPSYREGKVTRLSEWLAANRVGLDDSWFYSDSHNDLPLLNLVTHPVAVDPDATLADYARSRGWDVISLR